MSSASFCVRTTGAAPIAVAGPWSRFRSFVASPGEHIVAGLSGGPLGNLVGLGEAVSGLHGHSFSLAARLIALFGTHGAKLDLAAPTGDGGASLEFVGPTTGREFIAVLPDEGKHFLFIARQGSSKWAGVIQGSAALENIARWLVVPGGAFPTGSGIEVG